MILFLAAVLFSCGGRPFTHKGSFTNNTGQNTRDLHIVFNKKRVSYDAAESRTRMTSTVENANGKTIINLDGTIFNGANALGLVFINLNGDFDIEKWWWTIKEGGQSVMIWEEHTGPPNNGDQSGAWE
jgi:hypothetical protein